MSEKAGFLKYFFERIESFEYAALGLTVSRPEEITDTIIQLAVEKDNIKKILSVIELSPYLRRVTFVEKPYNTCIDLTLSNEQPLQIHLINSFVRKGILYMCEKEVLRNVITGPYGIKIAAPSYNFEYVWLIHCLNQNNVPDQQCHFFSKYDREVRTGIFAHIRGRYFLELNLLDDLYAFHKKTYRQVYEKILRRKENKLFWRASRKSLYVFYSILNLIKRNQLKIKFHEKGYKHFPKTEGAQLY
jgi:hypothetical protein